MLVRIVLLVVIDVKQSVGLEARMKGDAHQAFLVAAVIRFTILDVQKFLRVAAVGTFFHDKNCPGLRDDKETSRTVRRLRHPDRSINLQIRKKWFEFDFRQRLREGDRGKNQGTKNLREENVWLAHGDEAKRKRREM